jgi:hypothetical protein
LPAASFAAMSFSLQELTPVSRGGLGSVRDWCGSLRAELDDAD